MLFRSLDPSVTEPLRQTWDEAIAPYSRHRWVRTVREAVRIANPASESFLESLSRVQMAHSGLPQPQCGFPMVGDDGVLYWLDFWWEKGSLIGEADGLLKYTTPDAMVREKHRSEALTGCGRAMVRWGMAQVVPSPEPMLRRIRAHLLPHSPPRGIGWL